MEGRKKKRMDEKDKRVWKEKKKRKNLWMKWNERGKKKINKEKTYGWNEMRERRNNIKF